MHGSSPSISPQRSFLFVPGDSPRKLAKAAHVRADTLILDLEDAVAPAHKAQARAAVVEALARNEFGRAEVLVRLNGPATPAFDEELRLIAAAGPAGLVIPKIESAEQVAAIDASLNQLVPDRPLALYALIECARAVVNVAAIAAVGGRLAGLILGAEDLAADMGAARTAAGAEIAYARGAVVTAAAAFGLGAIDTVFLDFGDDDGLAADARLAGTMGFRGKLAIHPRQAPIINAAFAPPAAAVAWAERVVAAAEEHATAGVGVFVLAGQMIDRPVVLAAAQLLARARSCRERDDDS